MTGRNNRLGGYTPARAARFYVPLLLQAFSQSLTYPLVASIVTHGRLGVSALTAFAQGQTVMFMIGALGGGLVMTGMVFGRTRGGYRAFAKLNTVMMLVLLALQLVAAMPPFDRLIFSALLNLPAELVPIARDTLLWGVFMNGTFFLRNIPLVALFNARASAEANWATVARILFTAACPLAFVPMGLTGPAWGLVAMTAGCLLELVLTRVFAAKYVRALEDGVAARALVQFRFTLPLSFGGCLLAGSPLLVAGFVGRGADPVAMLAIHYVTIGVANPVAYAALRMQAVAIQFPPEYEGDTRITRFAVVAGLLLGIVPLCFALPAVSAWYFGTVQNVPAANVHRAACAMAIYACWPVFQSLRGQAEGYAAWRKKPNAVMAGQIAYAVSLAVLLGGTLAAGVPGWLMAVSSIFLATLATLGTVRWCVSRKRA